MPQTNAHITQATLPLRPNKKPNTALIAEMTYLGGDYYCPSDRLASRRPPDKARLAAHSRPPARLHAAQRRCTRRARSPAAGMVEEEKLCRLCWGDEDDGPLVQPMHTPLFQN